MAKQNNITKKGQIIENLPSTMFKVQMDDGTEILAHLAGRLRINHIKILPGDRVIIETTPYDDKKGRIVQRL